MKPFRTYFEQIEILKARGLVFQINRKFFFVFYPVYFTGSSSDAFQKRVLSWANFPNKRNFYNKLDLSHNQVIMATVNIYPQTRQTNCQQSLPMNKICIYTLYKSAL